MKKIRPKIRGWDWTELASVFGWKAKNDGFMEAHKIRNELRSLGSRCSLVDSSVGLIKLTRAEKAYIKNIRKFVELAAAQSHHTCGPIIKGLAAIKDDGTFLNYVELLLEHLWT